MTDTDKSQIPPQTTGDPSDTQQIPTNAPQPGGAGGEEEPDGAQIDVPDVGDEGGEDDIDPPANDQEDDDGGDLSGDDKEPAADI